MPRGVTAKRHAQAVFQIAQERKELDRWQSDLESIAATLSQPELAALLENPKIRFEEKARLVEGTLPGVSQLALNLVYLLVTRGRVALAGDIADEYQRLLDAHRGIEHVEVTTAVPLEEEQEGKLAKRLSSLTGKKVTLSTRVDPAIVGGLVARIGDSLLDGSTHSKLAALRKSLTEVR